MGNPAEHTPRHPPAAQEPPAQDPPPAQEVPAQGTSSREASAARELPAAVGPAGESLLCSAEVARLYLEHAEELRRFLQGVLRDSQLAHDVLQTSFARLVERGHETQPGSRKAWLFQVAFREALAARRRDAVGQRAVSQAAWQRDTSQEAADLPLIRVEEMELVREALEQLPEAQRTVVRMRIYEGKKFAQIAEELEIPLGTALGRMKGALERLRRILRRE